MKILKDTARDICFFSTMPLEFGGGAEILAMQTANILARKKHTKVTIIVPKGNPFSERNTLHRTWDKLSFGTFITDQPRYTAEQVKVELGKASYKRLSFWQVIITLRRADYIITRSDMPSLLPIMLCFITNPGLRKKTLIQFHTPLKYPVTKGFRLTLHNIVYTSFLYRFFLLVISSKLHVLNSTDKSYLKGASLIRIPCDPVFFESPRANEHIGKKKTIIIASRFTYQKGIDMLPALLKYLARKGYLDYVKFLLSGDGDMERFVIESQKKYKNIQYVKRVDHRKMPTLLSKGNIFLTLSRWEGSSIAIAEAMAKGLPVVAFRVPGIYSKRGKRYISFVDPFDIKEMGNTLMRLTSLPREAFKKQADESLDFAKREYTMDIYIKKLETLLYR